MKGEKYYKKLSRITPIATPVLILLHAIFLCFTYNKQEDLGDWGGLVLAANIIFSIIWGLIMWLLVLVMDFYCAYPFWREILKWLLALLNLMVWVGLGGFFLINNILAIINVIPIVVMGIWMFFNRKALSRQNDQGN